MSTFFWPMQVYLFWLDLCMLPWKLTAPVSESLADVAASPQALAGLDPASPHEIGTSATDFRS
jgi:hypothetical protein